MSFDSSGTTDASGIELGPVSSLHRGSDVPWSTIDAVVVLIAAFVIYFLGSIVVQIVDYAIEGKHLAFWVIPTSYLFLTAGVFVMAYWWLIVRRGSSWTAIGFRMPSRSIVASVGRTVGVAFGAFILVQIGANIITGIFDLTGFRIKSNVKELLPPGQSHVNVAQYLTLVFVGAILAPLTEETLFRGVIYQAMRRDASKLLPYAAAVIAATIVSGTLFGLFHLIGGSGELHTLPVLVYLGVLLAITFQTGRTLGASMLVHAAVNFASITYLFTQTHGS